MTSSIDPLKYYIYKVTSRETYAIHSLHDNSVYIPVLASIYEAGTDDPYAISTRLISTGDSGFWTKCKGTLGAEWVVVEIEDVTHDKWREFILLTLARIFGTN